MFIGNLLFRRIWGRIKNKMANQNPTMKEASENISRLFNPKKSKMEEYMDKQRKIQEEIFGE